MLLYAVFVITLTGITKTMITGQAPHKISLGSQPGYPLQYATAVKNLLFRLRLATYSDVNLDHKFLAENSKIT